MRKRASQDIPLNSNSLPTYKTTTPGDPAQFRFHTLPQNKPPRISRSIQISHPPTKRASPEIPLNSNSPPTHKTTTPEIPLSSNSPSTHKTSIPGDPAPFKLQHEHPSYICPWGFLYQGKHPIRSLGQTLENCEHKPSGASHITSIPGHPAQLKLPTHLQNDHPRRSRSIQISHPPTKRPPPEIPLNSNSPPSHKTSPPGYPAQFKFHTHRQNDHPWRSRPTQIPHPPTKRPPRKSRSVKILHLRTKRASPEIPLNSNYNTNTPRIYAHGVFYTKRSIPLDR